MCTEINKFINHQFERNNILITYKKVKKSSLSWRRNIWVSSLATYVR